MKLKHSPLPTALRNEVLAVSASDEDLGRLRSAFGRSSWQLHTARTVNEAKARLRRETIAVVLCACHLPDGDWKTLLEFGEGACPTLPSSSSFLATQMIGCG